MILTIDGVPAASLDSAALDARLNARSGGSTTVTLGLLGAHGETRTVPLVLRDVL